MKTKANRTNKSEPGGDDDMLRRIRACLNLRQWRDEILGRSQVEIAMLAKVHNSRISRAESGELPKNKRCWRQLIRAYQLEDYPREFERLALGQPKAQVG